MSQTVLIVEDEPSVAALIAYHLSQAGYETEIAANGEDGLRRAMTASFDLVLLDVMLPGERDGYQILRELRQHNVNVPVMMLTAKDEEKDIVEGLEAGADDYMGKPFHIAELLARVAAVIRRAAHRHDAEMSGNTADRTFQAGEMTLHLDQYAVEIGGEWIALRAKEFEMLLYMSQRPGLAVSRDTLTSAIWGDQYRGGLRIIDVYISTIRKRLESHRQSVLIEPVRGVGYKLVVASADGRRRDVSRRQKPSTVHPAIRS